MAVKADPLASVLASQAIAKISDRKETPQQQEKISSQPIDWGYDSVALTPQAMAALTAATNHAAPQTETVSGADAISETEESTPPPRRAFDIEANLNIETPRPDITGKYEISWGLLVRRDPDGNPLPSLGDPIQAIEKQHGSLLNYVMDKEYTSLEGALKFYSTHADPSSPHYDNPNNGEVIDWARNNFFETLHELHQSFTELGTADYAQEVFLKRSLFEGKPALDIKQMFQEFLGINPA